jgi:hypothetical protein
MQVGSDREGEDVCEQLRAAGIKCAVEPMPDPDSFRAIWGGQARTVLTVLVNESDMDNARAVVKAYESKPKEHAVSVCETRPVGDDPAELGTGFEATCECGWSGPIRESSDEAFSHAYGHNENVSAGIVRVD